MITWLVCGGRDFRDRELFDRAMRAVIHEFGRPDEIIHGGARGADRLAAQWAIDERMGTRVYPADWSLGFAAGPIRNQEMIEQKPRLVVAFPGGSGTADTVRRAKSAGVTVVTVESHRIIWGGHGTRHLT